MNNSSLNTEYTSLLNSLKQHVHESRHRAALSVNKELIMLYHHIGQQIIKAQSNAAWGSKIIELLAKDLKSEFPEIKGFSHRNLNYMRQFAEEYLDQSFVEQTLALLPWGHNVLLMTRIPDKKIRMFYIEKTIEHGWSRNIMGIQIETNLHNRQGQATTNFKEKLPSPQSELAHNTLKDPYLFDFLSIGDAAHEREIETALMQHIEKFLLELGEGFAFLGRQYPLPVEEQDFYIDLLFYHIKLRAFVVIELKAGKFEPEHAGKMNFYLSAVDDLLRQPGDAPSIGLILCKAKGGGVLAEYTLRDMNKPIGLAEYRLTENLPDNLKTALPAIEELEAELSKGLKDEDKTS